MTKVVCRDYLTQRGADLPSFNRCNRDVCIAAYCANYIKNCPRSSDLDHFNLVQFIGAKIAICPNDAGISQAIICNKQGVEIIINDRIVSGARSVCGVTIDFVCPFSGKEPVIALAADKGVVA